MQTIEQLTFEHFNKRKGIRSVALPVATHDVVNSIHKPSQAEQIAQGEATMGFINWVTSIPESMLAALRVNHDLPESQPTPLNPFARSVLAKLRGFDQNYQPTLFPRIEMSELVAVTEGAKD